MSSPGKANTKGLGGIVVGDSSIATVGIAGAGLNYRGYPIQELSENSTFEEVAYLLLCGNLPTIKELDGFCATLRSMRSIPKPLEIILENIPKDAHPMDVTRTICSVLGMIEPEKENFGNQLQCAMRFIALLGPAVLYWYHYSRDGVRINGNTAPTDSTAENFMKLLNRSSTVNQVQVKAFDVSLILYAEHEFAASTFAARITASTQADIYSGLTTGISTLKGNLHGGANEAAMHLLETLPTKEAAREFLDHSFANKRKIMGFGHRVYKKGDPRHHLIKKWSKKLSEQPYGNPQLFAVASYIEEIMRIEKSMHPNLDFFAASTYAQCGIPTFLFTPIFVISRTTGWAAHIFEQRADNRLIRPSSNYTGPDTRKYGAISERL